MGEKLAKAQRKLLAVSHLHQQLGDPLDVCECGDYRYQHIENTGPSKLNWSNYRGVDDCVRFRLAKPAGRAQLSGGFNE